MLSWREKRSVDAPPKKYSDELHERAVRLVFKSERPIAHVARAVSGSIRKRCGCGYARPKPTPALATTA